MMAAGQLIQENGDRIAWRQTGTCMLCNKITSGSFPHMFFEASKMRNRIGPVLPTAQPCKMTRWSFLLPGYQLSRVVPGSFPSSQPCSRRSRAMFESMPPVMHALAILRTLRSFFRFRLFPDKTDPVYCLDLFPQDIGGQNQSLQQNNNSPQVLIDRSCYWDPA